MSPTRENLHKMIDFVEDSEITFVFHMLTKLLPDSLPLPDEQNALLTAAAAPNDYIAESDIDWANLQKYVD